MASPAPFIGIVKAEFDYEATTEDEISIKENDILWLLEDDDPDWWKVIPRIPSNADSPSPPESGLVPKTYVELLPILRHVTAAYAYTPMDGGVEEMEIVDDEKLVVYDEGEDSNGEWIVAGREGAKGVGLVPGNYVEGADGTDAPQEPEPGPEPEPAPTPTAADVSRASAKSADARNVRTWNATEIDKKKKKKKGTLGIGNGALFFASESDKSAVQQYPLSTLTSHSTEKNKHLHISFGSDAELHFQISSKDHLEEIVEKLASSSISSPSSPSTGGSSPSSAVPPPPPLAPIMVPPAMKQNGGPSAGPPRGVRFAEGEPEVAPSPLTPLSQVSQEYEEDYGGEGEEYDEAGTGAAGTFAGVTAHGQVAIAVYDFQADGADELSIVEGEKLIVLEGEEGADWWKVRRFDSNEEGVVPGSYVEVEGAESHAQAQAAAEEASAAEESARLRAAEAQRAAAQAAEQRRTEAEAAVQAQAEARAAEAARRAEEAEMEATNKREESKAREREEVRKRKERELANRARGIHVPSGAAATGASSSLGSRAPPPPKAPQRPDAKPSGSQGGAKAAGPEHPNPEKVRMWRDATGHFKVNAEFLGLDRNKLKLHKDNGVIIDVPLEKMSRNDLVYLQKVTGRKLVSDDDDVPLAKIASPSQSGKPERRPTSASSSAGARPTPSARPIPSPQPASNVDWFDFFLNAGCSLDDCSRYERNFGRERMEIEMMTTIDEGSLRSLGLKEGDIFRVRKHTQKLFPDATPKPMSSSVSAAAPQSDDLVKELQRQEGDRGSPGLFSAGAGGGLKNTRRGRPNVGRNAPSQVSADSIASASDQLRGSTPDIARGASPLIPSAQNSTPAAAAAVSGFGDDAWTPRPSPKPPTPAQTPPAVQPAPPAPTPPALAPATSPPLPQRQGSVPQQTAQQSPQRSGSTAPSTGTALSDDILARMGIGNRPPSAPVSAASNTGIWASQPAQQPQQQPQFQLNNAARGPVAPVPQNQGLLAPLVPTPTGFNPSFVPTRQNNAGSLLPQRTGFVGNTLPPLNQPMNQMSMQPTGMMSMSQPMGMMSQPTGMMSQPTGMMSPSAGMMSQPTGMMSQPTGMMSASMQAPLQAQPTGFAPGGALGNNSSFSSPSLPSFMPPQPTGLSTASSNNTFSSFGSSNSSSSSTAPDKYQPSNIFASMKSGTFANNSNEKDALGPQSSNKYDALRPQPTGFNMGQSGFPQQPIMAQPTGFPGQFGGMQQPQQQLQQQPNQMNPMMYQQTGFQQPSQQFYGFQRQ